MTRGPPSAASDAIALYAASEREAATHEILQVISRSRDDKTPVLEAIAAMALRLCNAHMAVIWQLRDGRFELGARTSIDAEMNQYFVENPVPMNRRSGAGRAVESAAVVHIQDMQADPEARDLPVTKRTGARTLLAVPLLSPAAGPIGVIALTRTAVDPFAPEQIALVETFAAQAVIAIENVRQFRELQDRNEEVRAQAEELQKLNSGLESRVAEQVGELERMGRLKRFLSPQVADAVMSSGDDSLLASHRVLIAILFCDIRGFTAFCEAAEPEETIEVLQTYHQAMGELLQRHGAGVDHRAGDGLMVIFNDPLPCDDPAGSAVRLALAMRERMAGLCADWRRLGHRLGFGVGISLGYATVGMVGSEGRYDYTASGTAVNLAARLCEQAADGEILLSPRAFAAVEASIAAEPAGALALKGFSAPVDVFRVSTA